MSPKDRIAKISNVLFVFLLLVQLLPNNGGRDSQTTACVIVAAAVELVALAISLGAKSRDRVNTTNDVAAVIFVVLGVWTIFTAKTGILPSKLFPAPGIVFSQIVNDYQKILEGVGSSLSIIAEGMISGAVAALALGLLLGVNARVGKSSEKVVAFLSAIPPIVYIPYAIALLPAFRAASVLVIFLATFWPVLTGTLAGVRSVDSRAIESARVLNLSTGTLLARVILPGSLPLIFNGLNIGLCLSFILLTSAEMIGGTTGMGWYVKYYSDFGDYTRILAGIIVIGVVITVISVLFGKAQRYFLRWQ